MAEQGRPDEAGWPVILPGTEMLLTIPARLELLPVLGVGVREYCATLPHLFGTENTGRSVSLPTTSDSPVQASFSHFVYSTELILQEAASNTIRHGYGLAQDGQVLELTLSTGRKQGRLVFLMQLRDTAPPFDPTRAVWNEPDPHDPRESGYGIYLIRRLTDDFNYQYAQSCNYLRMLKYIDY